MNTLLLVSLVLSNVFAETSNFSSQNNSEEIYFFNRSTQRVEQEKVLGNFWINLGYRSQLGNWVTHKLLPKKWLSEKMGAYENSAASAKKIPGFIQDYNIDMSLFEETEYKNFNEFFIRKFKPGVRPFGKDLKTLYAGAEARYLGIDHITAKSTFTVKNVKISLPELLGSIDLAQEFEGGSLLIARLCPVDYHRFHFPVTGKTLNFYRIHGDYHSVNPVALDARPTILFENERTVTILQSETLGKVAMIEVGALGVGKIVQTNNKVPARFTVGQEKGYFLFGGSTVIFVVQSPLFKLDADILENSQKGLETWIPLGETLGKGRE